jgi:multidrug resistance efflux pump
MTRTRLLLVAIVVATIAAVIWLLSGGLGSSPTASPSPSLGPVPESDTVAADARAVPIRHAELAAPAGGGLVAEVLVEEGDAVTAGQALLRLDATRLDAQVAQAHAAVTAAEAQARQAEAAARQAGAEVAAADAGVDQASAAVKAADATRDGTPSGAAHRAANAEVVRARAGLRQARAQLTAARRAAEAATAAAEASTAETTRSKAALTEAQAAVADLTLKAPFAGIVASMEGIVGETVTPGSPIARIADTSAWRFESVDLDEAAVGRLDVGDDATITVDALPGVEIPAHVASISSFGESSAGDIVYTVTLDPTGDLPDGLRWNMTASAEIEASP